jgi:hypothetical protein
LSAPREGAFDEFGRRLRHPGLGEDSEDHGRPTRDGEVTQPLLEPALFVGIPVALRGELEPPVALMADDVNQCRHLVPGRHS